MFQFSSCCNMSHSSEFCIFSLTVFFQMDSHLSIMHNTVQIRFVDRIPSAPHDKIWPIPKLSQSYSLFKLVREKNPDLWSHYSTWNHSVRVYNGKTQWLSDFILNDNPDIRFVTLHMTHVWKSICVLKQLGSSQLMVLSMWQKHEKLRQHKSS